MCLSVASSDADISHHLRIPEWPVLFSSASVLFCGKPEDFSACDAQRNDVDSVAKVTAIDISLEKLEIKVGSSERLT